MLKISLLTLYFLFFILQAFGQLPDGYPSKFKEVKRYELYQNKMMLSGKEVPTYDSISRPINYSYYGFKNNQFFKVIDMSITYNREGLPSTGRFYNNTFTFQNEEYTFNSSGKLLQKDIQHQMPGGEPDFYVVSYLYDSENKLIETYEKAKSGSTVNASPPEKYYFYYDNNGRISEIYANKSNSNATLGGRRLLTYKKNYLITMRYQNKNQGEWADRAVDSFEYEENIDTLKIFGSKIGENQISLFPNPFGDKIRLKNSGENINNLIILLFDLQGRKVFEQSFYLISGGEEIELNCQGIGKGIYFLQCNDYKYFKIVKLE